MFVSAHVAEPRRAHHATIQGLSFFFGQVTLKLLVSFYFSSPVASWRWTKTYTQTQNPKEQNQRLVRTWSGPGAGCCPCFFDSYMCSKTFLQIMLLYVWHLHVLQKVHLHQVCAGTPNYPKIDAFWRNPWTLPGLVGVFHARFLNGIQWNSHFWLTVSYIYIVGLLDLGPTYSHEISYTLLSVWHANPNN